MAFNVKVGEYVTLLEACKIIPGRPSIDAVRRWCDPRGYKGIRLQSWRVGHKRVTSIEAINAFIRASAASQEKEDLPEPVETRELASARATLDAAGV